MANSEEAFNAVITSKRSANTSPVKIQTLVKILQSVYGAKRLWKKCLVGFRTTMTTRVWTWSQ